MTSLDCFRRRVFIGEEQAIRVAAQDTGWFIGVNIGNLLRHVGDCYDDEGYTLWYELRCLVKAEDDEDVLEFLWREVPGIMSLVPDNAYVDFMEGFLNGYVLASAMERG